MNHVELKAKALSNPETLADYENMGVEFSILRQILYQITKVCQHFCDLKSKPSKVFK